MNTQEPQSWFGTALAVGALYSIIGIVFALPSTNVRMWRLAAWIVSAAVYAAHIGYEHFRLLHKPRVVAAHIAFAAGIGAFGLAVAANVHELRFSPTYRPSLSLALIVWPVLVALPAFVAGIVLTYGLAFGRTVR